MADVLPDTGKAIWILIGAFALYCCWLCHPAPAALAFGFGGAYGRPRSPSAPLSWLGRTYKSLLLRGVPDIAFFLFFVIALDSGH